LVVQALLATALPLTQVQTLAAHVAPLKFPVQELHWVAPFTVHWALVLAMPLAQVQTLATQLPLERW
jgi:hypothetical protein